MMQNMEEIQNYLRLALEQRSFLSESVHSQALRLFNGFAEGCPELVVEVFADTLVLYDYSLAGNGPFIESVREWYLERLPWVQTVLWKQRNAALPAQRAGVLIFGEHLATQIEEDGVLYALDLQLNRDASFYLDTRFLRNWLHENMQGTHVLNLFSYTGSLGVAALAGKAKRIVQSDINPRFINLARTSYRLNGFPVSKADFLVEDFFKAVSRFKQGGKLFDCVILDAPFFSQTNAGRVDLLQDSQRLIQKVRPLVAHNGWLIVVNNALFLSGAEFLSNLEQQCAGGYLQIEQMISIPEDICGYSQTEANSYPADPTPFNHPTKIAILKVKRKDFRTAG